jgi:hypothetical protein
MRNQVKVGEVGKIYQVPKFLVINKSGEFLEKRSL